MKIEKKAPKLKKNKYKVTFAILQAREYFVKH